MHSSTKGCWASWLTMTWCAPSIWHQPGIIYGIRSAGLSRIKLKNKAPAVLVSRIRKQCSWRWTVSFKQTLQRRYWFWSVRNIKNMLRELGSRGHKSTKKQAQHILNLLVQHPCSEVHLFSHASESVHNTKFVTSARKQYPLSSIKTHGVADGRKP